MAIHTPPPPKADINFDIYTGVKILWGMVFLIILIVLILIYIRTRKEIARLVINTRTHSNDSNTERVLPSFEVENH